MSAQTLLDRHDAVLFDLDGTIYRGSHPIPAAADAVAHVQDRGWPVRFVTNNASQTPAAVAEHLGRVGVPATAAEVSTSAQAAALLLSERLPAGAEVLVVGAEALVAQIRAVGLSPVRAAGDDGVAAVVQGHSTETGWADLAHACVAVADGALWVACNTDPTLPSERGQLPGNGAMVAALETATGRTPEVAGKPRPPLLHTAADSAAATRALVVGDRLDTDIAGARAAGYRSLVVLTGVVTPAEILAASERHRPDYLAADLTVVTEETPAAEVEIGPRARWRIGTGDPVLTVSTAHEAGETGPERSEADTAIDLLRGLCDAAWRTGISTVRAQDDDAQSALVRLGLA